MQKRKGPKPKPNKTRAPRRGPPVRRLTTITDKPWINPPKSEALYGDGALARDFCLRIALGGTTAKVCALPGMPSNKTIWDWRHNHPEFAKALEEARIMRAELLLDNTIDISDDVSDRDPVKVSKAKLRIDTIYKFIAQSAPKEFGNKSKLELTGKDGAPLAPPHIEVHFVSPKKVTSDA